MSKPADLVQGTLNLLILKMVALEPLNGWAVGRRLRSISGEVLQVSDGSLYPALHKLERDGLLASEWRPSENNRRAKFYSLTRSGRKHLRKEAADWGRIASAISHVLTLKEGMALRAPSRRPPR
jgi:PadR family transcriptional regulator PadR